MENKKSTLIYSILNLLMNFLLIYSLLNTEKLWIKTICVALLIELLVSYITKSIADLLQQLIRIIKEKN